MLGLDRKYFRILLFVLFLVLFAPILMNPFPTASGFAQFNAGYPDLMQRFVIFGIFAIGYNILFGLTGYLSFGHAAFLGVGSYAAVWMFKLLSYNIVPALILSVIVAGLFSLVIGYVSLRRSGIYFSILTLAFAQMCFALAYSVFGQQMFGLERGLTNGETGLQVYSNDPQYWQGNGPNVTNLFGLEMRSTATLEVSGWAFQFNVGYYLCAFFMLIAFYISLRIFRSPFGLMLQGIKYNQTRMNYTGVNSRPYTLAAFVISGMYAGLAGGLMACMDPLAGAERMQWTASGEVVLMTILGGMGTVLGPVLGAGLIKYFENIFSKINDTVLHGWFGFLPDGIENFLVTIIHPFVGKGWHLSLGLMFMLVVIFLPGGIVDGANQAWRKIKRYRNRGDSDDASDQSQASPAQ